MSLVGIDVGTSSVKVAAFHDDGKLLAVSRIPVNAYHPSAGWEEMNPNEIWQAVLLGLSAIASNPELKNDPPVALAVSASGDEVFLTDQAGYPQTPCILSGDTRGEEIERQTLQVFPQVEWLSACGHVPERMDPVNRLLWWRVHHPEVFGGACKYLGWHEYIALRLCGRAVTDPSLASKWLAYDLSRRDWLPERVALFNLDPACMPEILGWGQPAGEIRADLARQTGLPQNLQVGIGAFDSTCAAIGSGVSDATIAGLACGSWQVVVAPVDAIPASSALIDTGFPLTPFPGRAPMAVLAQSPNGTAVLDWLAQLVNARTDEIETSLPAGDLAPGPILSIPHLSGAISPWTGGRDSRGALLGITLATSREDILKSLMESVIFDLHLTMENLNKAGAPIQTLRASGGGSRSAWWMQLAADLLDIPVEVVDQKEPGAFGAALLAGAAVGRYPSVGDAAKFLIRIRERYEPNPKRKQLYNDRINLYRETTRQFLKFYQKM